MFEKKLAVPMACVVTLFTPFFVGAQVTDQELSYAVQKGTVVEGCGGIAGTCGEYALGGELTIRIDPGTGTAEVTSAELTVTGETGAVATLELPLRDLVGTFDEDAIRFTSLEDRELQQFLEWTMIRAGNSLVLQGIFFEGCCDRFTFDFRNVTFQSVKGVDPATVLALADGRFAVKIRYTDFEGVKGSGKAVELGEDSGYFWFFDADNTEITVKVLDACREFGRFWFFAAGMTNVEVEIVVTDLVTGAERTYANPMGATFETILDVDAFATCDAGS